MNEAHNEINEALELLSVFSLSGDAVDIMATAKAHLRRAAELTEPEEKEDKASG